jgi:C-terminal processing protease CtpA/Prc
MKNRFFYDMIKRPDVKGIILDVRGNGGGDAREPGMILGGLTDKEMVMAYTKGKNGEGRLDYTPWIPFRVLPLSNATNITAPIVILTDINSVSCSELTTMGVRNLPNGNGIQIGKTTFGGNGSLTYNALKNGGQFSTVIMFNSLDPKYQQIKLVYTSSEMTKTAFDGKCYEGKGIPPNIDIALDINQYINGTDTQLERALQYIATGN